jgi:hypothetical protein
MGLTPAQEEDLKRITEGFIALTDHQQEGARNLPQHLWAYDQEDFIRASLGMFVELGELVNESQWKPWRSYSPPTEDERNKVIKEFGDVLHMLSWMLNNLRERFEIGPVDIAAGFMAAHLENIERFRGNVPGREPPREPVNPGFQALVDAAIPGPREAVLAKVAEIMTGREGDMDPEELEALDRLRDYISGENPEAVKRWVNRPRTGGLIPAL